MATRTWKARTVVAALVLGLALLTLTAGEARGARSDWQWPVRGPVITPYANDDASPYAGGMHRGIDVAAPVGTPVEAARAGEVTYAGTLGYSGLTVAVRTVDGYVTSYLHLSAVAVRRGQRLGVGARVGEVGTTGRRSKPEPHLHFGVRLAREEHRYVDPLSLLPPLPGGTAGAAPAPAPVPVPVAPQGAPVPAAHVPAGLQRAAPHPAAGPRGAPHVRPLPAPRPRPARLGAPGRPLAVPAARRLPGAARGPAHGAGAPLAPGAGAPVRVRAGRTSPGSAHGAVVPPVAAGDGSSRASPGPGWGRGLALAGVVLLVLAACGGSVARRALAANGVATERAFAVLARVPHAFRRLVAALPGASVSRGGGAR